MTTLTKAINEISEVLEMSAMDLYESINMHNMTSEHDQIETEDEIRNHLIEIAFNSRMSNKVYSKVCEINDNYFKAKLAD
tara:strand:+ start:1290 stop:1529 length:240 start_codon:yes stop_codon:yes gene_type:complete